VVTPTAPYFLIKVRTRPRATFVFGGGDVDDDDEVEEEESVDPAIVPDNADDDGGVRLRDGSPSPLSSDVEEVPSRDLEEPAVTSEWITAQVAAAIGEMPGMGRDEVNVVPRRESLGAERSELVGPPPCGLRNRAPAPQLTNGELGRVDELSILSEEEAEEREVALRSEEERCVLPLFSWKMILRVVGPLLNITRHARQASTTKTLVSCFQEIG